MILKSSHPLAQFVRCYNKDDLRIGFIEELNLATLEARFTTGYPPDVIVRAELCVPFNDPICSDILSFYR